MSGDVPSLWVAVSWCLEDEAGEATDALLELARDERAVVPSLWYLELGNVLLQAERCGRVSAADTTTSRAPIKDLPIVMDDETSLRALRETLTLARAEQLSSYDAAYLELAMRRGLPLATKDRSLRAAAERIGIHPIPE